MTGSLLFPRRCPICDEILDKGKLICDKCIRIPRRVTGERCFKCSKHLDSPYAEYCPDCEKHKKSFLRGIALYEYDSVKDSINSFKNNSRPEYAVFYVDGIERHLSDIIKSFNADVLVPIPLHPSKLKKRGYNQSELLANELSKRFGLPVDAHLLERTKKTKEQKKLTGNERLKNTVGAFHMPQNGVKYNNIILVDDVYTTGATLDEASRTLISGGLKNVYFVTVAIGSGS